MIIEETTEVEEKDEGFTLVELLIVIVILGILATIVVFAVRGITDQGQKSACKATAKTYEVAIEAYYAELRQRGQPDGPQLQGGEPDPQLRRRGRHPDRRGHHPVERHLLGNCSSVTL